MLSRDPILHKRGTLYIGATLLLLLGPLGLACRVVRYATRGVRCFVIVRLVCIFGVQSIQLPYVQLRLRKRAVASWSRCLYH